MTSVKKLNKYGKLDGALEGDGRMVQSVPKDKRPFDIVGFMALVNEKYNGDISAVPEEEKKLFDRV